MDGKMSMTGHLTSAPGSPNPALVQCCGEIYVGEEAPEGDGWTRDEDVLIRGSVRLYYFSTMGWPDVDSEDFKRYPTSTLVTGDIIPFWVSRMIFRLEFTGKSPFKMP